MKRFISILLCALCFSSLFVPAFANAPGPNLDETFGSRPFQDVIAILLIVFYVILIAFTCLIEWLVSVPFGMHRECFKLIVITNVISQVAMHLLEVAFFLTALATGGLFGMFYPVVLIALEIIVFASEFVIYHNKMLGFPTWQILLYTILANTASLVLGLLLIL